MNDITAAWLRENSGPKTIPDMFNFFSQWRPIEYAPKDKIVFVKGRSAGEIKGIADEDGVGVAVYSGSGDYAAQGFMWAEKNSDGYGVWWKPTHFMEIPQ